MLHGHRWWNIPDLRMAAIFRRTLGDLLVSNVYRVESVREKKLGVQEYVCMKQWLTPEAADVLSVQGGKGK